MHVPIALGGRLFGVLSAMHRGPPAIRGGRAAALASAFGAAGAVAHALEFQHERRIARALTRGSSRGCLMARPASSSASSTGPSLMRSAGAISSVSGRTPAARGDLVGDVSGKGLEVAADRAPWCASSSRRAPGHDHPGRAPAQANRILPSSPRGFATAFPAIVLTAACVLQRMSPAAAAAAGGRRTRSRSRAPGSRRASRRTAATRRRSRWSSETPVRGTDEAARDAPRANFFGDARLPGAARRARPHPRPRRRSPNRGRAGDERANKSTTISSSRRCGARRCSAAPGARRRAGRAALFEEDHNDPASARPRLRSPEAIFATERASEEAGRGVRRLYDRERPVGCGGVRSLGPELIEIKRRSSPPRPPPRPRPPPAGRARAAWRPRPA